MEISQSILSQIPLSHSDRLLQEWGYDLLQEYLQIARHLPSSSDIIVELATGTGRMCAILASLFPSIVSGDITLQDLPRVLQRLPVEFSDHVRFMQVQMEQLPFRTDSMRTIVCMNTLHETDHPHACLSELVRITHPVGTLAVGDFNRTGFDTMQRIHEAVYHNDHDEGSIRIGEIEAFLTRSFRTVRTVLTPLNITFIASDKYPVPNVSTSAVHQI